MKWIQIGVINVKIIILMYVCIYNQKIQKDFRDWTVMFGTGAVSLWTLLLHLMLCIRAEVLNRSHTMYFICIFTRLCPRQDYCQWYWFWILNQRRFRKRSSPVCCWSWEKFVIDSTRQQISWWMRTKLLLYAGYFSTISCLRAKSKPICNSYAKLPQKFANEKNKIRILDE